MSRAWFKPGVGPKLLKTFSGATATNNSSSNNKRRAAVEVWNCTDVVTAFGKSTSHGAACTALINPANPQLSGVSKFPYFPKGGPVPKEKNDRIGRHHVMAYVSQWGGMDVGSGMLFSVSVVDGLVHQLGGWKLRLEIGLLPVLNDNRNDDGNEKEQEKCPVGHAVCTGPGGDDLRKQYDHIIHTVPPFYKYHPDPEKHLLICYENALALAFQKSPRVACPLLGAGARGFPVESAVQLAAQASMKWREQTDSSSSSLQENGEQTLAFAIPDMEIAEALIEALENAEQSPEIELDEKQHMQ